MKQYQGTSTIGEFYLSTRTLAGQLKIDGENSELNLHSKADFHAEIIEHGSINGLLSDNTKVSLIHCTTLSKKIFGFGDEKQIYSTLFPHHVVFGNRHIDPLEEQIFALNFIVKDASTLFYDWGAFGMVLRGDCEAKEFLENLFDKQKKDVEVGEHPEIFYFSGKHEIFNSDTYLGKVFASHSPLILGPSPKGISVKNSIPIHINFPNPLSFQEAMKRFHILLNFVDIILGTPQHIEQLSINVETEKNFPNYLQVYSCLQSDYENSSKSERPRPSDILINGGIAPQEFSNVLSSWLLRQDEWNDSRLRFIQSFRHQNRYSIDRLVAAANMFDILPEHAVEKAGCVTEEVASAIEKCKTLFKNIHPCSEKDNILGALGRIGKHTLKSKVKNRAKLVTKKIDSNLPGLELIIDAAINCRNYYVHGAEDKITPEARNRFRPFFTDTLEFIFGASDLIEAEWDIKKWVSRGSSLSHPFARYIHGYPQHLKEFKENIA